MNFDESLENLIKNGSKFDLEKLKAMKNELQNYLKKNCCIEEIIDKIFTDLINETEELLYSNDIITCINASVFLSPNYHINVIGGLKNRKQNIKIDETTLFDIASITKMYTGLLLIKLKELNLIDFNAKINDLSSIFDLKDYTVFDIINMTGVIKTPLRIDQCKTKLEALETLKKTYIFDNNKEIYNYTDMGFILLSLILEELFHMRYDQIMDKNLIIPLNLKATYYPNDNITGNGKYNNKPNDPKASILDKPIASAGLFTNSEDITKLSKIIFDGTFNIEDLIPLCINRTSKPRGAFGSYTKHNTGLLKTYIPNEYSKLSFAYEGFTGSITIFDLINKINNTILVNALYDETLLKHPAFSKKMNQYQNILMDISIKLKLIDNYFENPQKTIKKIKNI